MYFILLMMWNGKESPQSPPPPPQRVSSPSGADPQSFGQKEIIIDRTERRSEKGNWIEVVALSAPSFQCIRAPPHPLCANHPPPYPSTGYWTQKGTKRESEGSNKSLNLAHKFNCPPINHSFIYCVIFQGTGPGSSSVCHMHTHSVSHTHSVVGPYPERTRKKDRGREGERKRKGLFRN